jgi:hypothetical protein
LAIISLPRIGRSENGRSENGAFGDWSFGDWSFGDWSFGEWSFGEWSVYLPEQSALVASVLDLAGHLGALHDPHPGSGPHDHSVDASVVDFMGLLHVDVRHDI